MDDMSTESKPLIEGVSFPPVIVEPSRLHEPKELTGLELGWLAADAGFDITSTYYDEYVVDEIDLPKLLAYIFGTQASEIPEDLLELARKLEIDVASNWSVSVFGYYDDEYIVEFDWPISSDYTSKWRDLERWYWNLPNARDNAGVLAYCRSKGLDTTGLSPLEAIKAQLAKENPGRSDQRVERATFAEVRRLHLGEVNIGGNDRIAKVQPRATEVPEGLTEDVPEIMGVLLQAPSRTGAQLQLVDGYHRMRDARVRGTRVGNFIVLRVTVW